MAGPSACTLATATGTGRPRFLPRCRLSTLGGRTLLARYHRAPRVQTVSSRPRQAGITADPRAWLARFSGPVFLVLAAGVSLADGLGGRAVAWESDTATFYYPLAAWASQQLQAGRFPLWAPQIFGGYPLFADGETGLASPIVLAALALLPVDRAFVLLRLVHLAIAGLGTYGLARAWRLSRAPATLAGLVFMLGSFMQAQIHHENVIRTAVWLPVVLACAERALRAAGRTRVRWTIGAALAVGLASLGLHVQVLLMDLIVIVGYGLVRVRIGPVRGAGRLWRRRAAASAGVFGVAAGLGLTLAAVQLVPLLELARYAVRGQGITYAEAAAYSLTPLDLVQMVLPFAFRGPAGNQWSLWTHWESYLYVGLLPLVLAVWALPRARRPEVWAWVLLGGLSLVVAFGRYSPINLHVWLWQIPVLNGLRAPGRFTLLVVLALAMLSAYGLRDLERRGRRRAGRSDAAAVVVRRRVVGVALAAPLLLAAAVFGVNATLAVLPERVRAAVAARYLALPHDTYPITPNDVLGGLAWTTAIANPRTSGALLGLFSLVVVLLVWQVGPWPRLRAWRGWGPLLLSVTTADLLLFAYAIHPREALARIAAPAPAAAAVQALQARDRAAGLGPYRVLAAPGLRAVTPNRLMAAGLEDANGYTSLEPLWHRDYRERVEAVDDDLLDVWNVRYVLKPAALPATLSYAGVAYRPESLLLSGPAGGGLGAERFQIPDGAGTVSEVRLVAALVDAVGVPQDTPVAEIILRGADGAELARRQLLAGRDLMDWGWEVAAVRPAFRHGPVEAAGTVYAGEPAPENRRVLSYARVVLDASVQATSVEIRGLLPRGELAVYGAALVDLSGNTRQLLSRDRAKYREVYRDTEIVVYENTAAFPRAFVVPQAALADAPGASLSQLTHQPFRPSAEVVLAAGSSLPPGTEQDVEDPRPPSARILRYEPSAVTVQASAEADAYLVMSDSVYPGWRAYVDGVERPLLRGDVLFRVVAIPPGTHTVEFRYQPGSLAFGGAVSGAALLLALVGLSAPAPRWPAWARRGRTVRWRQPRTPGTRTDTPPRGQGAVASTPLLEEHQKVAPSTVGMER